MAKKKTVSKANLKKAVDAVQKNTINKTEANYLSGVLKITFGSQATALVTLRNTTGSGYGVLLMTGYGVGQSARMRTVWIRKELATMNAYINGASDSSGAVYISGLPENGSYSLSVLHGAATASVVIAVPSDATLSNYELALTNSTVTAASKLAAAKTLWGQSFDGTGNVTGNMTGVGSVTASGDITSSGHIFATTTSSNYKCIRATNAWGSLEMGCNDGKVILQAIKDGAYKGLVTWDGKNTIIGGDKILINNSEVATVDNAVIDGGNNVTSVLGVPPKNVFSALNTTATDTPATGWMSGIVLSQNFNTNPRYKQIIAIQDKRAFVGTGNVDEQTLTWNELAFLNSNVASATNSTKLDGHIINDFVGFRGWQYGIEPVIGNYVGFLGDTATTKAGPIASFAACNGTSYEDSGFCLQISAAYWNNQMFFIRSLSNDRGEGSWYQLGLTNLSQEWTAYQNFVGGAGQSSDIRYKTDIKPLDDVLDDVKRLDIFHYTWNRKDDPKTRTFGVSAQQLESFGGVFAQTVHTSDDEEALKSVDYQRLAVIALKAVQEQQQIIDELRNEIEYLKAVSR